MTITVKGVRGSEDKFIKSDGGGGRPKDSPVESWTVGKWDRKLKFFKNVLKGCPQMRSFSGRSRGIGLDQKVIRGERPQLKCDLKYMDFHEKCIRESKI